MNARAKAYEVEDDIEAVFDYTYQKGWTDGLPVVPATPARVERMLATVDRKPEEIIAHLAPARLDATVEKVAVCAVMAGCRPEYFPAVLASVEAAGDPAYELYGVNTTTNPTVPMIIMNGPARISLDVNCSWGVLGPNKRANATIGRALSLAMINLAGRIPEETKADHYRLAHAFVMPGWGEGFGIVYLEALACGIPVLASAVDGSREAVRNGELGVLVNPRAPGAVAEGIRKTLACGRGPVPAGLDYFSIENFTRRTHEIVNRLVPSGRPEAKG